MKITKKLIKELTKDVKSKYGSFSGFMLNWLKYTTDTAILYDILNGWNQVEGREAFYRKSREAHAHNIMKNYKMIYGGAYVRKEVEH